MHHTSIIANHNTSIRSTIFKAVFIAAFTTSLAIGTASAKDLPKERRADRTISTGTEYIIIKEDKRSGDRIMRAKPEKPKDDCNKYTQGQYPVFIQLKPDISNYKK